MRDKSSLAMSRVILASAGAFLLASLAQAGAPTTPKNPVSGAAGAAQALHEPHRTWEAALFGRQRGHEPPRTWEATLFGRHRGGGEKSKDSRETAISVATALRGGSDRGGRRSRARPPGWGRGRGGGRGVQQPRQGRTERGARVVRWEDDEDDESNYDDGSDGYDSSEEKQALHGRRTGERAARTHGMGSREGEAAAARTSSGSYFSDEEELDNYSEDGDDSYDDSERDEDGSFGAYSFDGDDSDNSGGGFVDSNSLRRPPPPGSRSAGGDRGAGRGRGARRGGPSRGGRRGRRAPPPPPAMERLKARLSDARVELQTKMSGVTHKGAKVMRELKGSISSDLEKTLIKATRPDNDPAKRKHVNLLLQAAEHAFPAYMNPEDDSLAYWKEGPYWMTLHKLWRRMAENDYRTAAKAVYVLHRLARGTTAESWGYFRATLQEMRREEDRGTKSRYFSRRIIRNVGEDGRIFSEWLDAYAEFALLRLQSFSPDLRELSSIDAETPHEEASRLLEKAAKLIEAALACELGPDIDNDVTCDGLKLVVEDLCELWSLFQQKLEIRLQQRFTNGGFTSGELRRTLGLLEFYLEQLPTARALVQESHRLLEYYSHAVPKGLGDALATEMLQEQVAWIQEELTVKAKALVGKPVAGGGDASPSPSPPLSASKARKGTGVGAAPAATARKPAPAPMAVAPATKPTAAPSATPAATTAKQAASKKPAISGSSVTAKRKASGASGGGDSAGGGSEKKAVVRKVGGEKKAEGAAPGGASKTVKTNKSKTS